MYPPCFEKPSPKILQRQLYASWVASAIAGLEDAELAFRYRVVIWLE